MTIFERDKERGGGIVLAMPTTNDTGAVKNRPAPQGKPIFGSSAALLLLGRVTTMPRRRALHPTQIWASKIPITYGLINMTEEPAAPDGIHP